MVGIFGYGGWWAIPAAVVRRPGSGGASAWRPLGAARGRRPARTPPARSPSSPGLALPRPGRCLSASPRAAGAGVVRARASGLTLLGTPTDPGTHRVRDQRRPPPCLLLDEHARRPRRPARRNNHSESTARGGTGEANPGPCPAHRPRRPGGGTGSRAGQPRGVAGGRAPALQPGRAHREGERRPRPRSCSPSPMGSGSTRSCPRPRAGPRASSQTGSGEGCRRPAGDVDGRQDADRRGLACFSSWPSRPSRGPTPSTSSRPTPTGRSSTGRALSPPRPRAPTIQAASSLGGGGGGSSVLTIVALIVGALGLAAGGFALLGAAAAARAGRTGLGMRLGALGRRRRGGRRRRPGGARRRVGARLPDQDGAGGQRRARTRRPRRSP